MSTVQIRQGQGCSDKEKIYNPDRKQRFLSRYSDGTQHTYRRIFINSFPMEEKLCKDLCDFTAKEIREFLVSLNPLTYASSRTNGRIVASYINWAIKNEQRLDKSNTFNPLSDENTGEWLSQFANENATLYISEKTMQDIIKFCENAQDAVIIRCMFEGVSGKRASELINMRKENVNTFDNILELKDEKGSVRSLEVSDECIRIIKMALKQDVYYKKNNMMYDAPPNVATEAKLVDNDFVIRNVISNTERYKEVDRHTIYRRLDTIKKLYGNVEYLSPKNIQRSGMIWQGKKLVDERVASGKTRELTKKEYLLIAERYNFNDWWRLQEWVNLENIDDLYGDD